MCYQAFVHYACGHEEIVDAACAQAEGIPFYVKHACADYQYESKYPNAFCGIGRYYCGLEKVDGPFLDGAHATLETCQGQLMQIDEKLAGVGQKAMHFKRIADQYQISDDVREKHPAYGAISKMHNKLMQQRIPIEAERAQTMHIIKEAVVYFQRRRQLAQEGNAGSQPVFVLPAEVRGRMPVELEPPTSPERPASGVPVAAPTTAVTQQSIDISQDNQLTRQALPRMPPSDGDNIHVTHVHRDGNNLGAGTNVAPTTQTPRKTLPSPGSLDAIKACVQDPAARRLIKQSSEISNPRRRKNVPQKKLSTAPIEDSSSVRRSTRVRKKKVSYAESQSSDISRDNSKSPDKYVAPPEKSPSESSGSPELRPKREVKQQGKPQRGRNGRDGNGSGGKFIDTLASRIGDWQRRSGNAVDGTLGKSTSQKGLAATGRQAAAQQSTQQNTRPRGASSNLWRASPSAHAQVLMTNGAPFTEGHTGMSGLDNDHSGPTTQYTNSMLGAVGHPFPDITEAAAVIGSNIFNSYLQQSWPGANMRPQPVESWSVQRGGQRGGQYNVPQMTSVQMPLSTMTHSNTQPQFNHMDAGTAGGFAAAFPTSARVSSEMQPGLFQNSYATEPGFMHQGGFSSAINGYGGGHNGGHTRGATSGLQTPGDSSRADSVTQALDLNPIPDMDVATYFDYPGMHRSFSTPHDLSPAKTPDAMVADTEPKKRVLPASSPTPAAKRVRLSLPGQVGLSIVCPSDSPNHAETARMAATSSPAKMSTEQDQTTNYTAPIEGTVHVSSLIPPPAPIIAPTAIHFPQSKMAKVAENLEDAAELPGIGDGEGEQLEAGDRTKGLARDDEGLGGGPDGNHASDIDWGLDWSVFDNE